MCLCLESFHLYMECHGIVNHDTRRHQAIHIRLIFNRKQHIIGQIIGGADTVFDNISREFGHQCRFSHLLTFPLSFVFACARGKPFYKQHFWLHRHHFINRRTPAVQKKFENIPKDIRFLHKNFAHTVQVSHVGTSVWAGSSSSSSTSTNHQVLIHPV